MENQRIESIGVRPKPRRRTLSGLSRASLALGLSISSIGASPVTKPRGIVGAERLEDVAEVSSTTKPFPQEMLPVEVVHKYIVEVKRKKENFRQWLVAITDTHEVTANQASSSDEEFLRCTRSHESDSAGGYQAVSPNGYYGAYQFLISTWNNTAEHAGRLDLVGVRPDQASPEDQDDLALDLYHWQGNAPWEGRC